MLNGWKSGFGVVIALFLTATFASPVRAYRSEPLCVSELDASPPQEAMSHAYHHGESAEPMCGPIEPIPALLSPAQRVDQGVIAYRRAHQMIDDGDLGGARLQLDLAHNGLPRIRDHITLRQAQLALLRSRPHRAAALYMAATETVSDDVRLKARTGYVEALAQANDLGAVASLEELLWDYPDHPQEAALRVAVAKLLELRGHTDLAAAAYRGVFVELPESPLAREALESSLRLNQDAAVLSTDEQVQRARRLVQRGPLDEAKLAVFELLRRKSELSEDGRLQAHWLAARLARHSGDWVTASANLQEALRNPPASAGFERRLTSRAADMRDATQARDNDYNERAFRKLRGQKPLHRLSASTLVDMVDVATRGGLKKQAEMALSAILRARRVKSSALFRAAVAAVDLADPAIVRRVLTKSHAIGKAKERARASYHLARLAERAGQEKTARSLYRRTVTETEAVNERYYAMWSEIAIRRLNDETATVAREGFADVTGPSIPTAPAPNHAAMANQIRGVGLAYDEAYPWFGRAEDLFRVGEADEAQGEMFRAYIAYRQAGGRQIARAGLESVARGADRTRTQISKALKESRSKLSNDERAQLATVAQGLGDHGLAGGFIGPSYIQTRPRAYEWAAVPAANRYGLDPNLLLAVMRVESVYQKRIVSYAGAIGLMQIMPRTGRLIAQALGKKNFVPSDLLDPATNIEFGAWYLASLIRRFEGHLPLAIAAYNGGPHNVRRWIRESDEGLPLDAMLERIPFDQTHRYVRRVLVHYEAYRAQQGLPMQLLSTALPAERTDPLSF